MTKKTPQQELILRYLEKNPIINPSELNNTWFESNKFGRDTSRRCRELESLGEIEQCGKDGRNMIYRKRESSVVERVQRESLLMRAKQNNGKMKELTLF